MSGSVLDRAAALRELLVLDDVKALLAAFHRREGISVRIFELGGKPLCSVDGGDDALTFLLDRGSAVPELSQFVASLKKRRPFLGSWESVSDPVAGLRFLLRPLENDMSTVGLLLFGPYQEDESIIDEGQCARWPILNDPVLRMRLTALPKIADDALLANSETLHCALNAMCHSGYRALLASEMHLESINTSYLALEDAHRNLNVQNETLLKANARLKELDELKSNFLATVSHELRTPLTSVIGYSEMLLEGLAGPINDEQAEYLRTIMERGMNLLEMIGSILEISTIQRGSVHVERVNVALDKLVENALSNVRPQALKKNITLVTNIESALPPVALDRQKTRQALINLLGNAVKFTPTGGQIKVAVHRCTMGVTKHLQLPIEAIRFAVEDSGIGIPEEKLEKVFEAFYQVDNSSTRKFGGAGLGLSIVKNFIEAQGGTIQIKSVFGQGTTLAFILPVPEAGHDGRAEN